MSNEDKNSGSLVLDLIKLWRHVQARNNGLLWVDRSQRSSNATLEWQKKHSTSKYLNGKYREIDLMHFTILLYVFNLAQLTSFESKQSVELSTQKRGYFLLILNDNF